MAQFKNTLNFMALKDCDPEVLAIIQREKKRQTEGLELIASENFTSTAVMECLGSCLTNKYSEGQVGARYYGGTEHIDEIETLCKQRAYAAYSIDSKEWDVNVQPYSGSPANFAVYTALLNPHDRVMGLDLPSGGHLTHGYQVYDKDGNCKKISATSIYFESMAYKVNVDTGLMDYDRLQEQALEFRPKMIIAGSSAYPRDWDFKRFRQIADSVGAYLFVDMAHFSGLVATKNCNSPFEYADVVTTTCHKTLRGPRSGMIFSKRDKRDLPTKINFAVFPGLQGGPHNHQIAAVCTQLREVATPEFAEYTKCVMNNMRVLGETLQASGHKLATDGTVNHLLLWDLRPHGITGSKMETVCEAVNISLNKNTVAGDKSALTPGGVRIGSPGLTSRNFGEEEFKTVAKYLMKALDLAKAIQTAAGTTKLVDFKAAMAKEAGIAALRAEVVAFASKFPLPGL